MIVAEIGGIKENVVGFYIDAAIDEIVREHGDQMPNAGAMSVQMPHGLMGEVVTDVILRFQQSHSTPISRSTVYKRLKEKYSHVKCPKRKKMLECADCADFKNQIARASNKQDVLHWQRCLNGHRLEQFEQRRKYWKAAAKAHKYPNKQWTWLFDGFDKSKCCWPRLHKGLKSMEQRDHLCTHTLGFICDGSPVKVVALLNDDNHYSNDANLTVSALVQVLKLQFAAVKKNIQELMKIQNTIRGMTDSQAEVYRETVKQKQVELEENSKIPDNFYCQADNATVNKCETVIQFLSLLVFEGIFKKVRYGFMMVGHTHDIVDQMFSKIAQHLEIQDVMSEQEYFNMLPKCYAYSKERKSMHMQKKTQGVTHDVMMALHNLLTLVMFILH